VLKPKPLWIIDSSITEKLMKKGVSILSTRQIDMSTIYTLQGDGDCGKTATLRFVYQILNNKYNVSPSQRRVFYDIVEIMVILFNINGKKVGIASFGDMRPRLNRILTTFEEAGCDIIFCACRRSGKPQACVRERTARHTVHFIDQIVVNDVRRQAQSNKEMAELMIERAGL